MKNYIICCVPTQLYLKNEPKQLTDFLHTGTIYAN